MTILYQKSDLDRSKPVRMVGYPMDARGWTFVDSRGKLIVTRHARFDLRHIDERNPDFQPGVEVVQLPGFDIGLTDSELRKRCYNFDNEIVKWSDPTSCDKAGDTCPTDAIPVTPSPIRDSPSGVDSSPVSVLDFDESVVCQRKRTGPSAPVLLSDLKNMPPNTRIEVRQDNPKHGMSRIRYEVYKGLRLLLSTCSARMVGRISSTTLSDVMFVFLTPVPVRGRIALFQRSPPSSPIANIQEPS